MDTNTFFQVAIMFLLAVVVVGFGLALTQTGRPD